MNLERVVYIGDRPEVGKEWNRRRFIFPFGKTVKVPDAFAERLLGTLEFVREDDFGRPVVDCHEQGSKLLFRRWGAMGDLLMFRAAVSAFLRFHDYDVVLRCQERFKDLFVEDPLWEGVHAIGVGPNHPCDGAVTFDQVAEADHRGIKTHRVSLFLKAMTKEPITLTPEDWRLPIPKAAHAWVKRHLRARGLLREQRGDMPLIGVHTRGSGSMKSLPREAGQMLVKRLREAGRLVMLLEPDSREAKHYMVDDEVFEMAGRDALHGISLIEHLDLLICMDSGPLWMAHCANCPILAILGPTRPEERISLHPRYPQLAEAVCLNQLIGCEACFEAARACNGAYRCMMDQPNWSEVIKLIDYRVSSMLKRISAESGKEQGSVACV